MNDQTQTIYGISVSELTKEPVRVKNGTYYNFRGYNLYVPDEVDSSTAAFIYYPGSGGSGNDAKIIRNMIESGTASEIIVIADDAYTDRSTGGARHLQLIENIGRENSCEITNIDCMGFSASGPTTFNTILNTISTYPDNGKYSAVFCDVVNFNVSQEQIDILKDNESTLIFLEPDRQVTNFEKALAQGGVDVIIAWAGGGHGGHVVLNREALENGIIDFVSGVSDELANSDIYKFVKYDAIKGEWYQIPLEEVAESFLGAEAVNNPLRYYDRLSNMDTDLKCHNSFLANKINNIRTAIKNSNFLSTTSMEYYSSTTQIPNAENEVVQAYFSSCAKSLNCLEKDTAKIIEIGNSIKEINDALKDDAAELNSSLNYYTNGNVSTDKTTGNNWADTNNTYNSGTNLSTAPTYVPSYTGPSNSGSSGSSGTSVETTQPTEPTLEERIKAIKDEFLEYNELCSDSGKNILVYRNTVDKCKVVIHYEGETILSIDHYYQYPTQKEAMDGMKVLKEEYSTNCEDILRETNTLKVVMEESTYKDLTVSKLREQFKETTGMVEITKK